MKFAKKYIVINFLIWTAVALFDFSGDYFNEMLWDREFNWREEIPFVTAWYVWFLLTPIAVAWTERWMYANTPPRKFLFFHIGMFMVLNVAQILIATLYMQIVGEWLLVTQPFRGILYKNAISGTFYNVIIYGVIVLVINSIRYYKELQKEQMRSFQLERKLSESRMQFLKQQLQPHFLFNTHHSIITLMKMGAKEKAVEMMEKLSDLMRFALRETSQQQVTLAKEMHLVGLYLDIQKIRFADKLKVVMHIQPGLENVCVPAMLLQPLVENSIKYAVEPSVTESMITIEATAEEQMLTIVIKDDGCLAPALFKKGIGISNTEERLEELYGRNHQFSILPCQEGNSGTSVSIKIPLHHA